MFALSSWMKYVHYIDLVVLLLFFCVYCSDTSGVSKAAQWQNLAYTFLLRLPSGLLGILWEKNLPRRWPMETRESFSFSVVLCWFSFQIRIRFCLLLWVEFPNLFHEKARIRYDFQWQLKQSDEEVVEVAVVVLEDRASTTFACFPSLASFLQNPTRNKKVIEFTKISVVDCRAQKNSLLFANLWPRIRPKFSERKRVRKVSKANFDSMPPIILKANVWPLWITE